MTNTFSTTSIPLSIALRIFSKRKHIRCTNAINQWVDYNWKEFLDEDTVNALYDLFGTEPILGKNKLNDKQYESYIEFQTLVADNAINKIKESLIDVKDHDDDDDDDDDD